MFPNTSAVICVRLNSTEKKENNQNYVFMNHHYEKMTLKNKSKAENSEKKEMSNDGKNFGKFP